MAMLNRFIFVIGCLFLFAGAGLMTWSCQILADNQKLTRELQSLRNYLHYEHISSKVGAPMPPPDSSGIIPWYHLHQKDTPMPPAQEP